MTKWTIDADGETPAYEIHLVTPEELEELPDGTELIDIFGRSVIKGHETTIDGDTRFGHLAYGLRDGVMPTNATCGKGDLLT